jgi:hypothetical protein
MRCGIIVLAAIVGLAAVSGCKGKSDASTQADPAAVKAQQDLIARRDALLAQRQEMQTKSDALDVQIKDIQAKGGDASQQLKEKADLDTQIQSRGSEFESLSGKLDAMASDKEARLAQREAEVLRRETAVLQRERDVSKLALEWKSNAEKWKDSCSGGTPVIIQAALPKGGSYSRKDIEPLLTAARKEMLKRGLLASDLGPASGLEAEATKAMSENDWGKAYLAAAQLSAQVHALPIDRAFIMGKYNRLKTRVDAAGGKLEAGVSQQLTDGMKDVLQKYGDGQFDAANHKLNTLYQVVK